MIAWERVGVGACRLCEAILLRIGLSTSRLSVLQALCTEASLQALRRSYPQIYDTDDKLLINPDQVVVGKPDFLAAHAGIIPAAHRQAASHAR